MKKGFLTGLLSFVIAKVAHLLITGTIGFVIGMSYSSSPENIPWGLIRTIDNPIVGIIFLIFATRFVYKKLTKTKNNKQILND